MTDVNENYGWNLPHRQRTALYFPYVAVPKNPWFTRVLLYWDQAAAIVPLSLGDHTAVTNNYMRALVDEGLLREVSPHEELAAADSEYSEAFLEHLEAAPFPTRHIGWHPVHIGKLPPTLFTELRERGLAVEMPHGPGWWLVQADVADRYMTYLASFLSAMNPGMTPVTDRAGTLKSLAPKSRTEPLGAAERLDRLRYAIIDDVLPAPKDPVEPAALRRFKQENEPLLRACLDELNDRIARIVVHNDPDIVRDLEAGLKRNLSAEVAELQAQMARRRWGRIASIHVTGLAGTGYATLDAIDGVMDPLSLGLKIGAGALAAAGPVIQMAEEARAPRINLTKPMAYAVMASRLPGKGQT